MKHLRYSAQAWTAILLGLMLTACGGGSDEEVSTQAADKYAGIWDSTCVIEGSVSAKVSITYAKTGPNTLSGTSTGWIYPNKACSGTPSSTQSYPAAIVVDGTGTASGKTVDKVTETSFGSTDKEILLVEGTQLISSADGSPLDAQGYPTALEFALPLIRR